MQHQNDDLDDTNVHTGLHYALVKKHTVNGFMNLCNPKESKGQI